jgi:hypothetical protein
MSKEADIICIVFYINSIEYAGPKICLILGYCTFFFAHGLLLFTIVVVGFHEHMVAPKSECWIQWLFSGKMPGNCQHCSFVHKHCSFVDSFW